MGYPFTFTVFTPTYNRAHTLPMVYQCLKDQTFKDFEWLIVDDGSVDATAELVAGLIAEDTLSIRYFRQENGGKHRACNYAVSMARGELFLTLDSDDFCVPAALDILFRHWEAIPIENRSAYSAVTALCMDQEGKVVGSQFPADWIDSTPCEMESRFRVDGEKWGFQRTDIMEQYLFPEFEGEKFMPEGVVWERIGENYMTRYVNEKLRIYEIGEDSLSGNLTRLRVNSPKGVSFYYNQRLSYQQSTYFLFKSAINFLRFSLHAGQSLTKVFPEMSRKFWFFPALLPAYIFYFSDKLYLTELSNGAG